MINMSALADVVRELSCRICEFLFLKYSLHETCKKKQGIRALLYYLYNMHTEDLFMDFLLPVPPQNVALILKLISID